MVRNCSSPNPANGAAEGVVSAHSAAISALAFSADRGSLITAAADGTIRSWALPLAKQKPAAGEELPKPKWEFKVPGNAAVAQMKRLSQDQGLLIVSADGTQILRLKWDGTAGAAINSPAGVIRRLEVAIGGARFLATSDSGHIHLFAADGNLQKSIPPVAGLTAAKFDREAKQLLICDGLPRVRTMSVETGRVQEEIPLSTPVVDADWIGAEQRSVIAIGAANEATLGHRSLVRLWDEMPGGATAVAFVPNQPQLLAAGADGKIRQWSLTDGAMLKTFEGSMATIAELAITPNGQALCAVGDDKTLQLWKMADATRTFSLTHPQAVRSVTVSADSARVATACVDGLVRVFDIATGVLLESFREHVPGTAVQSVRYVNDNATLISTGDDKTLQTMKTSVLRSLPVHTGAIRDLVLFSGGGQTLSSGLDGKVVLTNLTSGNADRNFAVGDRKPTAVACRPDNQRVAVGFESGDVVVFNSNNGEQALLTLTLGSPVGAMSWSTDNRNLLVSTADNVVRVFGPSLPGAQPATELILHQQFTAEAAITDSLFSPDGRSIWTSLANGRVDEWSYAGPEQRRQFNHGGPVYGVDSNRDGSIVISCSTDQTVRVWDTLTGQQKFQLNGHTGPVHAIAMSPDETFAISSGADGTLRLWDIVGGRQLKQLTTYPSTMYSVSVHPQGTLIAAAGADRKVHVLDMITGTEQRTLPGHTDYIHCVTFSPNGEQMLSYGYSGQLKLWNTADGRLLYETRVGRVGNYAQFDPDGRRVVVSNGDGTAGVHQLP
ncbi:MAG: WD40 repeat domain-containing protein [Planctomycetaceae bacterium]